MIPQPTGRLRFREMDDDDLDAMAGLLGDPEVMRFYPRPRTRAEALDWIRWSQRGYAEHGHALWVVETLDGRFVGDCGLTYQPLDNTQVLEVGYHTTPALQGHGYATEAARACVDLALGVLGHERVVAIIHPDNAASRRVATKVGLRYQEDAVVHGRAVVVHGRRTDGRQDDRHDGQQDGPAE